MLQSWEIGFLWLVAGSAILILAGVLFWAIYCWWGEIGTRGHDGDLPSDHMNWDPLKYTPRPKAPVDQSGKETNVETGKVPCYFRCSSCKTGVRSSRANLFKKINCPVCGRSFHAGKAYASNPSDRQSIDL